MQLPAPRPLSFRTTCATYPGSPEHVSRARVDLRAPLEGCPIADDVLLCLSELATNAVLHSDSRFPGGTFTVRSKLSPGWFLQIEVKDDGGPWLPGVPDPARGHGHDILRALADDWGIEGDCTGRTIWARFDWPHS